MPSEPPKPPLPSIPPAGTSDTVPPPPSNPLPSRRPSRQPGRPSEDTLLSAPIPADSNDAIFDERLTRVEMRLIEADRRVTELEAAFDRTHSGSREWLLWVGLVGLLLLAYKVLFG
ncbi:MAG: hypothetical protein SFV15_02710 [Polyangiaceae bacterium]|nr:hypothetical protein [Polyangiaceae bacterium]